MLSKGGRNYGNGRDKMDDAIKLMRDDLEEARQELLAAEFPKRRIWQS